MYEALMNIDSALMPAVFGEYDINIKKLEKELGVSVIYRDEYLKLRGEKPQTEKAKNVLGALFAIAERKEPITTQTMAYLIASATEDLSDYHKLSDEFICLTVNGRPVRPKTLGQKKYIDLIRKNSITFGIGPAGTGKTYLA
ncbi:MAG: PhoH family protein, partial [Firmicutes bacterium]|nr:PhoH family protein [Bacillota bacterium]